jgi:hypothetical protein
MRQIFVASAFAAMLTLAAHGVNRARGADPGGADAAAQSPANPVQTAPRMGHAQLAETDSAQSPANPVQTAPEPPVRDYFEQLQRDQAAAEAALRAANEARRRALGVTEAPPAPDPIPGSIQAPAGGESNRPVRFTHQEGRFSIVMPRTPKCSIARPNPEAPPITETLLVIDRMEYQVTFRDMLPEEMNVLRSDTKAFDRTFKLWLDWAMNKVHARLERLTRRVVVQRDALEFETVLPDGRHWIGWYFLVGDRLYQVNILGPGLTVDHPTTQAFIDSFQLVESR